MASRVFEGCPLLMAILVGTAVLAINIQVAVASLNSPALPTNANAPTEAVVLESPSQRLSERRRGRRLETENSGVAWCINGQSFQVLAPRNPSLEGCYSVVDGEDVTPPSAGRHVYTSPGHVVDSVNGSNAVIALDMKDPHVVLDKHWVLGFSNTLVHKVVIYCISAENADVFTHPSRVSWSCDFTGNQTFVETTSVDLNVTCGCSGPPRSPFDPPESETDSGSSPSASFAHLGMMLICVLIVVAIGSTGRRSIKCGDSHPRSATSCSANSSPAVELGKKYIPASRHVRDPASPIV